VTDQQKIQVASGALEGQIWLPSGIVLQQMVHYVILALKYSHVSVQRAYIEAISAMETAIENIPTQTAINVHSAPPVPPFASPSGVELRKS
jgi:hypothetical protein